MIDYQLNQTHYKYITYRLDGKEAKPIEIQQDDLKHNKPNQKDDPKIKEEKADNQALKEK